MKLFLLKRKSNVPVYDVCDGFVIRAHNELDARSLASERKGDEGTATWLDDEQSTCVVLDEYGDRGVVLMDFNAG